MPILPLEAQGQGDCFIVWLSGDGGWSALEREVAARAGEQGVPTVGVNSLLYFWRARNGEETARALDEIVRTYSARWSRAQFVLVGYSFGADRGPAAAARLSPDVARRLRAAVFLSPSVRAADRVGLASWLGRGPDHSVAQAILSVKGAAVICVAGARDRHAACPAGASGVRTVILPGGHTLHGDGARIAALILNAKHS
ncbi:MAG: AcvB/VirJ family lysyl-phosphatidylglycerol hydrolase [Hyphomonadaceae bacterium]